MLTAFWQSGITSALAGEGVFTDLPVFLHVNMRPLGAIVSGEGLWVTLFAPVSIACFLWTVGLVEAFIVGLSY